MENNRREFLILFGGALSKNPAEALISLGQTPNSKTTIDDAVADIRNRYGIPQRYIEQLVLELFGQEAYSIVDEFVYDQDRHLAEEFYDMQLPNNPFVIYTQKEFVDELSQSEFNKIKKEKGWIDLPTDVVEAVRAYAQSVGKVEAQLFTIQENEAFRKTLEDSTAITTPNYTYEKPKSRIFLFDSIFEGLDFTDIGLGKFNLSEGLVKLRLGHEYEHAK